jgi:uncharacterized OB-fold protein
MSTLEKSEWARKRISEIKNHKLSIRVCDNCGQMVLQTQEQCDFCGCEDEFDVRLEPYRQHPRWEWPE